MMANLHTSIREPAPEPAPARAPRKKKEEPEHIEPESDHDSDSGSESSTYEEFEEVNKIKSYFESDPCESISPAALGQAKTTKEAVKYLKSKNCPKIPNIKKSAKSIKMDNGPPAPGPETAPAKKRVAKPKAAAAPPPALEVVPAPAPVVEAPKKVKKVKAVAATVAPEPAPVATPAPAPAAAAEKKKRAPSAYAALVGKLVKEKKMSFGEAAKAAKAELDAKKKQ
jgi:hypothetical protein